MIENKIFTYNSQKEKLCGIESIPDSYKEKYPAVIMVHGFHSSRDEKGMFNLFANEFTNHAGIITYRFDFSGCGESEGNFRETSLTKQKQELNAMINYVYEQSCIDKNRVGILAMSFGGVVAIALGPKSKFMILMSAPFDPYDGLKNNFFGKNFNPRGISIRETNDKKTEIGPQFWKDIIQYDLSQELKKIDSPFLLINGANDLLVTQSDVQNYMDAIKSKKMKIEIPNANHKLEPYQNLISESLVNYVERHFVLTDSEPYK
ncbi:MAG: alpha/beta hydrolase [Nanoarchaeota archaeon]